MSKSAFQTNEPSGDTSRLLSPWKQDIWIWYRATVAGDKTVMTASAVGWTVWAPGRDQVYRAGSESTDDVEAQRKAADAVAVEAGWALPAESEISEQ